MSVTRTTSSPRSDSFEAITNRLPSLAFRLCRHLQPRRPTFLETPQCLLVGFLETCLIVDTAVRRFASRPASPPQFISDFFFSHPAITQCTGVHPPAGVRLESTSCQASTIKVEGSGSRGSLTG